MSHYKQLRSAADSDDEGEGRRWPRHSMLSTVERERERDSLSRSYRRGSGRKTHYGEYSEEEEEKGKREREGKLGRS